MQPLIYHGVSLLPESSGIPSENYLYKIGRSRHKVWLFKDPLIHEYQELLITRLSRTNLRDIKSDVKSVSKANLYLTFGLCANINSRDTTNMVKATEDAVVQVVKFDDSLNYEVHSKKVNSPVNNEFVAVVMELVNYEKD